MALGDDCDDLLLAPPRPWHIGQKCANAGSIHIVDTSVSQPNPAILCKEGLISADPSEYAIARTG